MKSALAIAITVALLAAPALAENRGKGKPDKSHSRAAVFCPPGLAKKSPACVPPGQAKKAGRVENGPYILHIGDHSYRIGDRLVERDYHYVTRPALYGLDPLTDGSRYVIAGNSLLRVDNDTLALLALIRAVDAILD
jgi:hypothetical protein